MKLIVGLGNPGTKYENTRHNIGFMVEDSMAKSEGLSWRVSRDLLCYWAKNSEYLLVKPTTFMNKSGEAVRSIAQFYKIDPASILVIHDDVDLPFGKIRISFDSMSAGHNGVQSVIKSLAGPDFARLRIGVSHPRESEKPKKDPADYVLEKFTTSEEKKLPEVLSHAHEAIRSYLSDGIQAAMNRFN